MFSLLLHWGHPSSFPASCTPHAGGWHSSRGCLRPLDQSKRFCRPWGRDFPLPGLWCTNSEEFPSRTALQGVSSLFQNGWRGCKPDTHCLPRAICRGFSRLGSQVWAVPAGACCKGSAGRQSGCSGQTTAQVMQEGLCFSLCSWSLRLPVCRAGAAQSPASLCHSSRLQCFLYISFARYHFSIKTL